MKYCKFCGKPLENNISCSCEESVSDKEEKTKILKRSILFGTIIIVIALAVSISIAVISVSNRIDAFEYIEVSFSGYNTNGSVEVNFDIDNLITGIIGEEPDELEDSFVWEERYDQYYDALEYEVTPKTSLSNDDEITVTIIVSDVLTDKVNGGSRKYTVSNLHEVETVDVFAALEVGFSGVSGSARVTIDSNTKKAYIDEYSFDVSPNTRLSNGDMVTLTINNVDSVANEHYVIPKELSKEYKVENLPEYVTIASQIPDELIKELAAEFIKEKAEGNDPDSMFSYGEVTYYGSYFLTAKEGASFTDVNRLEIFVSYDEYKYDKFWRTVYTPLYFTDILIYPDGTIDIKYEDGENSTFTTDMVKYAEKIAADYDVTILGDL